MISSSLLMFEVIEDEVEVRARRKNGIRILVVV
jgi:hypothetical protein